MSLSCSLKLDACTIRLINRTCAVKDGNDAASGNNVKLEFCVEVLYADKRPAKQLLAVLPLD